MTLPKVYLAGPDVFLPDAVEIGAAKRRLCATHGFEGLFPLDTEVGQTDEDGVSGAIFRGNVEMMRRADIVVANLTPFRSVSADPGTVFELGFAFALGKAVYGYSNVAAELSERVARHFGRDPEPGMDGRLYAADGMAVENFRQVDNLMMAEAVRACGSRIIIPAGSVADPLRDLTAFEACLVIAAAALGRRMS